MLLDEIQIDQDNNVVIVKFNGADADLSLMQELTAELIERMRYSHALYFVLNMETVRYLSSACIGVLVEFLQEVSPTRGRIALACCQENVEFLFKVTKLDSVIPLFDEVQEAVDDIVP